jgi:hypothetical protein
MLELYGHWQRRVASDARVASELLNFTAVT